jgi:hypothetical protein
MGEALLGGPDVGESCAICLSEYEEGEELRVLPCKHSFRRECIDAWISRQARLQSPLPAPPPPRHHRPATPPPPAASPATPASLASAGHLRELSAVQADHRPLRRAPRGGAAASSAAAAAARPRPGRRARRGGGGGGAERGGA